MNLGLKTTLFVYVSFGCPNNMAFAEDIVGVGVSYRGTCSDQEVLDQAKAEAKENSKSDAWHQCFEIPNDWFRYLGFEVKCNINLLDQPSLKVTHRVILSCSPY